MSDKAGGPYTKPEQEKRRAQVYQMHFEKSISAIKIAESLGVNKNTIHEDIKYWYSQLADEFDKMEIRELLLKQYFKMEKQRDRLELLLEKEQNLEVLLKLERMIFDLDMAITKMIAPIAAAQKSIPESEVKDTIEKLLSRDTNGRVTCYSDEFLLQDIIQHNNCDLAHAKKILTTIKGMGLEVFKAKSFSDPIRYDLLGFAEARNWISGEKLQEIYSNLEKLEHDRNQEIAELQRQDQELEAATLSEFIAKYGDKSNWSDYVWSQYHHRLGFEYR